MYRELSGESVLLELETGHYFSLDEVGTRMWELLSEHGQLKAAFERLISDYDVEPDRLKKDLIALVENLLSERLLEQEPDIDS